MTTPAEEWASLFALAFPRCPCVAFDGYQWRSALHPWRPFLKRRHAWKAYKSERRKRAPLHTSANPSPPKFHR